MTEKSLSPLEIAKVLKDYQPGKTPEPIWNEMLRLNATATTEIIPYRIHAGKIQVYMTRRPTNDPDWPNQLHCPGTMNNGDDETVDVAIKRIKEKELLGAVMSKPEEIAKIYRDTPRGVEDARVFIAKVYGGLPEKNWYDTENLPNDTIDHHVEMINVAKEAIKARGRKKQTAAFE